MGQCQSGQPTRAKLAIAHVTAKSTRPTVTNVHKSNGESTSRVASPIRSTDNPTGAERFLRSFLGGAETVLSDNGFYMSSEEKHAVLFTFMNTCVEFIHMKFRMKTSAITDMITELGSELKLKDLLTVVPEVQESYVDDGFSRLLSAWFLKNTQVSKTVDSTTGNEVMSCLGVSSDKKPPYAFSDILLAFMCSATTVQTMNVFSTFAHGHDVMTEKHFAKFLRETQKTELTDTQVSEKCKYRFGGAVHRYNFNTYTGCLLSNSALYPSHTLDVWQDMTRPLTRYFINTTRIESEDDLNRALSGSCRAFVLNLKKNENGVLCSGTCPFDTILDGIKTNGFMTNPYPIILCMSPQTRLPLALQDEVAEKLTATLGTLLAKGLMFEGAIISDPKFSPAAQRKKVLVLGHQSRLKPFIGCLVADMNRDGLGVRVTSVLEGTPAAKAGLAKDDWLTHVNSEFIRNKQHLRENLAKYHLGEEFTLRRENLEELKVVVGGTVDTTDTSASSAFSNILFLKYAENNSMKPWETQVCTPKTINSSVLNRKDLDDHFAFVSINRDVAEFECVGAALRTGIQLIDGGNTQQARIWANGRFVDNGHSGYLIKTDLEEEGNVGVVVDIIAGPKVINGPPLTKGVAIVYGAGSAKGEGTKFTFKGCNETTTAVINCEFEQKGSLFRFSAAFPPALLRAGYRVLPLEQTGGPKEISHHSLGAYCFIRRVL